MDFEDIRNYRQAAPDLATSGQPKEEDLADIAEAGYQVVINLALHDDPRYSLKDEAATVRGLGMHYVHIPVRFEKPTPADLGAFFEAMELNANRRIWLHCAANMRVTAFLGLFRVLRQNWKKELAFDLMHGVWKPNKTWADFILGMLARKR